MPIQLKVSKKQWDREYTQGRWRCLDKNPLERARSGVIAKYCQEYAPAGRILDVGCGVGTLFDFLSVSQKKKYLGIDISEVAIKLGRKGAKLKAVAVEDFSPKNKFEVIVFNEILYYVDYKRILRKFRSLLTQDEIMIISLYRMNKKHYDNVIWNYIKKEFKILDQVEVCGLVKKQLVIWKIVIIKNK